MDKKQEIQAVLYKHNLTVESVFVPFSQSRNAGEKMPSLNWKVTLKQGDRAILTTDYMAGCGHTPAYKSNQYKGYNKEKLIAWECENGKKAEYLYGLGPIVSEKTVIMPDSQDVIYSLLIDSEVLDAGDFETWAYEFGYDKDSRAAEKVYNACLKIALQFRKIGESVISELREAYQDY